MRQWKAIVSTVALTCGALALAGQAPAPATRPAARPNTYCNPICLPDYPLGRLCRDVVPGTSIKGNDFGLWLQDKYDQYRELADVSVLWHEGKWYMYPSVDMAWVSSDGATWEHHPLTPPNIRDIGYAPTIVKHKGKFLLMASDSSVYQSDSPLGPFKELGPIKLPAGVPGQTDPMLFSDDDGKLYYYWGCTPTEGIFAIELDAADPTKVIGKPVHAIPFEPDRFPWQRLGDWNEDPNKGWVEGSWMLKRNGTYYLTYSAAGTENRTYAVGCATSKSPLGPFTPQKNNPILRSTTGLITGSSHGSFVEGPNNSLWAFYTLRAAVVHGFERRLGMDPAYIGDDGELHVRGPSETPQLLPTATKGAGPTGWLPLNTNLRTWGSTTAPNLTGRLAVDEDLRTWWQPAADDKAPVLTSVLRGEATVNAVRIAWRDIGLNTTKGVVAGAFRYKVEAQAGTNTWTTLIDRSASTEDLLIDYRECPPTKATAVRLTIVGTPAGITPGVAEFSAFGEIVRK
jgi:xylan 1,4-beta-xylosidase